MPYPDAKYPKRESSRVERQARLSFEEEVHAQDIADLRFALRQATDRASLAEIKCGQLAALLDLTGWEEIKKGRKR